MSALVKAAAEFGAVYLLLALSVRSLRPHNVIRFRVVRRRPGLSYVLTGVVVIVALAASRP